MANNPVLGIDVIAKLDQLQKDLAKIPGLAEKDIKAMVSVVSKQIGNAEKAAASGAKKSEGAWKSSFKGIGSAAKASGLESVVGLAGDVGEAFEAFASSPVALAVGAFAAVAAGATAVVAGMGAAVFASDEALKSLEGFKDIGSDFYPSVPKETLASIAAVNASTTALGSIWDRLVVDVGSNVAPAFEKVADVAVGLALTAMETFEEFTKGKSLLHEFAVFMTEGLVNAILGPITPFEKLAGAIVMLAHMTGVALPSGVEDTLTSFSELNHTIAENTVSFYEGAAAGSDMADGFDALADKGSKFISVQQKATKATEGAKAAADAAAAALKAWNDELERQRALSEKNGKTFDDAISKMNDLEEADKRAIQTKSKQMATDHAAALQELDDLQKQALAVAETVGARETIEQEYRAAQKAENAAYYAEVKKYDDELAKTLKDNAKKTADAQKAYQEAVVKTAVEAAASVADSVGSIASTMMESYSATNDKLTDELEDSNSHLTKSEKKELAKRIEANKKAALDAFYVWQAASIASATITGIMTVINAVNDGLQVGGPVGLIVGAAAGVAAGIGVAAQIAQIASTPPPSFHRGLAPDEYSATLKAGEGVLSTQGVAAAGGSQAVRDLNNGGSGGGSITIYNVHRHKIFDAQVRENIKAGGKLSGLASATRSWHRSR